MEWFIIYGCKFAILCSRVCCELCASTLSAFPTSHNYLTLSVPFIRHFLGVWMARAKTPILFLSGKTAGAHQSEVGCIWNTGFADAILFEEILDFRSGLFDVFWVCFLRAHKHDGKAFGSVCVYSVVARFTFSSCGRKLEGAMTRRLCHNWNRRVFAS